MKTILLVALFLLFLPELVLATAGILGYTYGICLRVFASKDKQRRASDAVHRTLTRAKARVDGVNKRILTVIDGGKA